MRRSNDTFMRHVLRRWHLVAVLVAALSFTSCQEKFDDRCAREAREYTEKHCPQAVDDYVVMDSVAYDIATRTYHYYYTMTGALDTPESLQTLNESKQTLRISLLHALNNSIELKRCKEEGINFEYHYYSGQTHRPELHFRFTKDDYRSTK